MLDETLNQELETDDWELPEISDEKVDELTSEEETEAKPSEVKTEEEKPTEEKPVEETEVRPFLKTKFNGEEKDLTEDEAREFAQKGMNYDKVLGRYNELNGVLEEIAFANDMDVNTFLGSLKETQTKYEVSKELNNLKTKYPDTNEEVLKELAQKTVSERLGAKSQQIAQEREQQLSANEMKVKNDIARFRQVYPNVEIDKMDASVYEDIKNGYGLLEAYQKYVISESNKKAQEAEKKIQIEKQNASNKSKSLGDVSSVADTKQVDDFMEGWNSVD